MGRASQGLDRGRGRYEVVPRVLCFVTKGDAVLLLRGSPQKRIWGGLYNGIGGHLEPGEDIRSAAVREVEEETGLAVHAVRLCGVVHVDVDDPTVGILFFVFTAETGDDQVTPSAEGTPEWFPKSALPAGRMVEDLPELLSRALAQGPADPPFFALYSYDEADRLVMSFRP